MEECVRIIDSMDISDKAKRDIHSSIDEYKREFLNNIGKMVLKNIQREELNSYVEHTHKGLNLRFTARNPQTVKEIKAICEYAGLSKIEESKTNVNSKIVWLRFTVE